MLNKVTNSLFNKNSMQINVGLVSLACAVALPVTALGYSKSQHHHGAYTMDVPQVTLPPTLPNWLLIPQNDEVIEAGSNLDQGYSPILIAGAPVVSSPYYGVQTEFQGSDLLVNAATINKDLALLQVRQNFYNALTSRGEPIPQHTILELSGSLEAQITKVRDYDHDMHSDINLTGAELDIFAGLNNWVSAFLQIEYDASANNARRVSNSRVKVGSAFATFGNLNQSDVYFTIGQLFTPFGQFSSSQITNSHARDLGRTKARAAVLGYYHQDGRATVNASAFAYKGDTDIADRGLFSSGRDEVNSGGLNVSYHYDGQRVDVSLGASVTSNIAESDGLQGLFASHYFARTQMLRHNVPAIDLRAQVKSGQHKFITEYVGAVRGFDKNQDLSHNNHGAKPSSVHVEYAYSMKVRDYPSTLAVAYDHSWDSLAFGLPEQSAGVTWSVTPWRATVFSIEYRYDNDYGKKEVAGRLVEGSDLYASGTGHHAHNVTAQLNVFF